MTAQTKGVDVRRVREEVEFTLSLPDNNTPNDAFDIADVREARDAITELIEAVKTQRTIAEDSEPWNWPGACQTYAVLVGLPACPCPSRAAITKQADDNVAAALARVGGAQ